MTASCAILDDSLLLPAVQANHPSGRDYQGTFHQALRCPHCAYVRFPSPDNALLEEFYNNEYPKYSVSWYNYESDYALYKIQERSRKVIDVLDKFGILQNASVHEFGCAFGGTVDTLRKRGYDATGTDLNRAAISVGNAHGNNFIYPMDAVKFVREYPSPMHAIYSFHALEHFTDPFAFMKCLAESIDDNGLIITFLPSASARFPLIYGNMRYEWFGYPEHLHLFSAGSAEALADRANCVLLDVASYEFGLQPEATERALRQLTPAARLLNFAPESLIGEELLVVMAKKHSQMAKDFIHHTEIANAKSRSMAIIESQIASFNEESLLCPWTGQLVA